MTAVRYIDTSDDDGRRLAGRIFALLSVVAVLFVLGVSFVPSDGRLEVVRVEQRQFFRTPRDWSRVFEERSVRDVATNVLLFIPLGVFVALAAARPRVSPFSWGLLVGPVLSVLVEALQGLTNRYSDVVDVATNSAGHVLGFVLVAVAVNRFGLQPGLLIGIDAGTTDRVAVRARTLSAVRFLYVGVYFVVALLPFQITVSVSEIYGQLLGTTGRTRLILDPLHHFENWPEGSLELLLVFLGLIPVAALTTLVDAFRSRRTVVRPVLYAVLVAAVGEVLKLFNLARTSDVVAPILAVGAGAVGIVVGRVLLQVSRTEPRREESTSAGLARRQSVALLAAIGYGFVLCLLFWYPYRFEPNAALVVRKLKDSNPYPFRPHVERRDIGAALDIVEEAGLFVPLGILFAILLRSGERRRSAWTVYAVTAVVCGTAGATLELSQLVCEERYVDATDAILAAVGGVVGVGLSTLLVANEPRSGPRGDGGAPR